MKKLISLIAVGCVIIILTTALTPALATNKKTRQSETIPKSDTIAIIDAGSSGSRIRLYSITPQKQGLPEIREFFSKKITPGISEMSESRNRPEILTKFTSLLKDASKEIRNSCELYLLATAGMRLLDSTMQESIYKDLSNHIDSVSSNFKLHTAMTICGEYEGLYGWLASNYLSKRLTTDSTVGILEIGGASFQQAFEISGASLYPVLIRDYGHGADTIYSKSYLYCGVNEMRKRVRDTFYTEETYKNLNDTSLSTLLKDTLESPWDETITYTTLQISYPDRFYGLSAISYTLNDLNSYKENDPSMTLTQIAKDEFDLNNRDKEIDKSFNAAYAATLQNKMVLAERLVRFDAEEKPEWTLGAVLDIFHSYSPQ